jgi:RNA-directed DNA polymerase
MNSGDCRCIRYIDDFIILAAGKEVADRYFSKARTHLKALGMEVSRDKTFKGEVALGFEFLGIELGGGLIRPTRESRKRLLASVSETFDESASAFRLFRKSGAIPRSQSLIRTLYEVSVIVYGWGKQYKFCNEKNIFSQLDGELDELLRKYLGVYDAERRSASPRIKRHLLGIPLLEELASSPFEWPKHSSLSIGSSQPKDGASVPLTA